jgi:chromosome segregation ATPase
MKTIGTDILKKLKRAERRLESLNQKFQSLESEKQRYLQEIMRGGQLFREVKKADQVIKEKSLAISKAKKEVSNLRAQLQGQLGEFRRDLIEEKQRELNQCMEQRARYLKRIEELEVEISRYRYLVTGKKDRRLAKVKYLLPSEIPHQDNFVSIDEAIGHIKLEVYKITRMSSEALLKEYMATEKKRDKSQ